MFDLQTYSQLLQENKKRNDSKYAEYHISIDDNEGCGFAIDGPIVPEIWHNQKLRILYLLKETHGQDGCDACYIMGHPEKYNDSVTNRKISKLSYLIHQFILNNNEEQGTKGIEEEILKDAYSKIAIIEVKKTSTTGDEIFSNDGEVRDHSRFNKDYIAKQITMLDPHIIICGGNVTWYCLTEDCGLYDRTIINPKDERKAIKYNDKIVFNSYHPSYGKFNVEMIAKEITALM